ncbi:SAM hydrolase/SAM-dependent halogenase family protein [Flavobacterium microcysteis]|uniref:SAM-dependent chlorinase/fluorinase n=1 Tax=Flavobacterium microcysteis TaxID=2596891 RepID=A0A501Q4P6_9FLAO|nr:SAM-dependent chlorinase/fluorinase [Flavobacterium microcysteis]TPD67332.1 SAM-dependent chlorinase/fluorinase [Flavobacterium microcysteis]
MSIITLTTDFGYKDHFVGSLKGKIYSEYPEARIVDISHEIDLFNVSEASYMIGSSYQSFPKGTVHIIGVDSELHPETQHIAMQWNDQYFICADNGILSLLIQKIIPQKIVSINIHDRLGINATAMDVFVTVACHLARGGLLNVIGKEITKIKEVTELQAVVSQDNSSIKGYAIYIDHFGNVVTNISKQLFTKVGKGRKYEVNFKNYKLRTILPNYSSIVNFEQNSIKFYEGKELALFNEAGFLEIAIYRSNPNSVGGASSLLGLKYRDFVSINFI